MSMPDHKFLLMTNKSKYVIRDEIISYFGMSMKATEENSFFLGAKMQEHPFVSIEVSNFMLSPQEIEYNLEVAITPEIAVYPDSYHATLAFIKWINNNDETSYYRIWESGPFILQQNNIITIDRYWYRHLEFHDKYESLLHKEYQLGDLSYLKS